MSTSESAEPEWPAGARELWRRVVGDDHAIAFEQLGVGDRRHEIECDGSAVHVRATGIDAVGPAIQHYLRSCGRALQWDTPLPIRLPELVPVSASSEEGGVADLYYLNFCTFAYTTPFWGWAEWEREIDWMALHGVTMPLALVGHEAVLDEVYRRHGLSDNEVRHFLGSPSHLPFVYMGCIDSLGGPLPSTWIAEHLALGRRILERQRSLGMTPVLPAFTGHVPRRLAGDRGAEREWQGISTRVLSPDDPLFRQLTVEIAEVQRELFDTDHLYASDPFIEMIPDETDAAHDYAERVASAIVGGLRDADPEAVWVLQSWPFSYQRSYWTDERVQAFLARVPDAGLLVIDLHAEAHPQWSRLDGFFGRPWLWGGLLNFGGRSEPVADLESAHRGMADALDSGRPPRGLAMTMEAIHVSPVFFELVADRASRDVGELDDWVGEFPRLRYGIDSAAAAQAWRELAATVFSARAADIFPEKFISIAVLRPTIGLLSDDEIEGRIRDALFYDPAVLQSAWGGLLEVAREHPELADGPLGADLVSVGSAVLIRLIDHDLAEILDSVRASGLVPAELVERFLSRFDDLDVLASTRAETRLGTWEQAASGWAQDAASERALLDGARRILTTWNTVDNPHLDDYSARLWSGLVGGYHKRRWAEWLALLPMATMGDDGLERTEAELAARLAAVTTEFLRDGVLETPPSGVVETSSRLLARLAPDFTALPHRTLA